MLSNAGAASRDCQVVCPHQCFPSPDQCAEGFGQTPPMANKDRATNPPPETPGGEGWLVSAEQQLVCQFKPDSATVHAQWVAVRTYSWVPPLVISDRDGRQRHRGGLKNPSVGGWRMWSGSMAVPEIRRSPPCFRWPMSIQASSIGSTPTL